MRGEVSPLSFKHLCVAEGRRESGHTYSEQVILEVQYIIHK